MGQTVRIDREAQRTLDELAERMDRPKIEVLGEALKRLKRQFLLESSNSGYAALKTDAKAWKSELAERALWEGTVSDGIGDE